MQKTNKVALHSVPDALAFPLDGLDSEAATFLNRAEELCEQYMSEMDACSRSEHPEAEARILVARWLSELRAEQESRLARLELAVARLARQRTRH